MFSHIMILIFLKNFNAFVSLFMATIELFHYLFMIEPFLNSMLCTEQTYLMVASNSLYSFFFFCLELSACYNYILRMLDLPYLATATDLVVIPSV